MAEADIPPERRSRGRPRSFNDASAQNMIQSLDRAMMILEELSRHEGLSLSDLAGRLSQSPATVYRVLVTLETRGIVELDPATQHWLVGAGAFLIGSRFLRRTSVVDRARPFMRALMERTGETANLGVARGDHVLFLSQVETHASIRAFFPPGTLSPLHVSGIGKALLAVRGGKGVPQGGLQRFTPRTITAPQALLEDLERTRARGWALDDEERTEGMRCVAAAVFDAMGEPVAGLSISGPVSRVTPEAVPELGAAVAQAARDLSAALGYGAA
jgi:IclR family acetate operon transcriptional repressor